MIFIITLVAVISSGYSPIEWSPNSLELALVAPAGDGEVVFPEGWLWHKPTESVLEPTSTRRQLWLVDVGRSQGFLLDETEGSFSSPAWAPKEQALAYTVFTPDPTAPSDQNDLIGPLGIQSGKLELVIRSADGKRTVLHSESGQWPRVNIEALPTRVVAWSPNGRYLAFPWLGNRSLKILNIETEKVEAEWSQGSLPSWSPTGEWLAFFDNGTEEGFQLVRSNKWTTDSSFVPAIGIVQPVVWEAAGDSFLFVRPPDLTPQARADFAFARRVQQFRCPLVRVHVPDLSTEVVAFAQRAGQREEGLVACYASIDPKRSEWAISILAKGVSPRLEIVSSETTSAAQFSRRRTPLEESAFDTLVPVGALSYSRTGLLAYRFGIADWGAPIAIDDSHQGVKQSIAPTMAMRMRGLYSLVFALEKITQKGHSAIRATEGLDAQGRRLVNAENYREIGFNRTQALDLFELPERQMARPVELREAIDEITRQGLELIDQAPPEQLSPILRRQLAETELFFRYLREDYVGAVRAADRIAGTADGKLDEFDLLALDTVRLQCLVEMQRKDAARVELDSLARRIEKRTRTKDKPKETSGAKPDEQTKPVPRPEEYEPLITRILYLEEQMQRPKSSEPADATRSSPSPPKPE